MEIQKIIITKEESELLSGFLGEDIGLEIDFNRLMPVVEKCKEVRNEKEKQYPEDKDLDDPTGWRAWSYRSIHLTTDIDDVYEQVIEFIK